MTISLNHSDITVVIPTFNRRDVLLRTLECLNQSSPFPFQIIVVCDGSHDNTAEAIRQRNWKLPTTVMEQPNMGAASARNTGAIAADTELVLFIDDDMRAEPGLIEAHLATFNYGADAVVGNMGFDESSPDTILGDYVRSWSMDFSMTLAKAGITSGLDILSGHLAIRRDLFLKLDGFSERFTSAGRYGNEDLDFGQRLFSSDVRIEYQKHAVTRQYYCVSASQKFKQIADNAETDYMLSLTFDDHGQLLESRLNTWGKTDIPVLDWIFSRFPKISALGLTPIKLLTISLIDRGRKNNVVHTLFGICQAVVYRSSLAQNTTYN